MKLCRTCKAKKKNSFFHKRKASIDGLAARCKDCQKSYDAARANLPHRVAARERYQKTDEGIEASSRAKRNYIARNPTKRKAHIIVGNAIRDKKLFRKPCEECMREPTHAHHDDYLEPLNVRWLCSYHHNKWHKENGEGKNARSL